MQSDFFEGFVSFLFQDLLSKILDYIEFRGIRMMDFFRTMDKSGKMVITKAEFKKGLETAEIHVRSSQVNKFFELIDEDGTGHAKYKDFVKVLKPDFITKFAKKRNNHKWDH